MSRVLSVTKASSYDRRRALAEEADHRQQLVIESVRRSGFAFDWPAMLRAISDASDPVDALARAADDELRDEEFRDTVEALAVNGKCIAMYIQRRTEQDIGIAAPVIPIPMEFRETSALFTPSSAVAYWQKILKLTDEEAGLLLAGLSNSVHSETFSMAGRIRRTLMERIANLHREVIEKGLPLSDFITRAKEILPDASRALLENEFRTRQTQAYGGAMHELIVRRAHAFPFTQFIALVDSRTTWWICRPMGTCVNGRGYIAATEDVIWFIWRPPNHFGGCRSMLSPISYLEAQRMKILAPDGRTKLALPGVQGSTPNRPFGPPPKFATGPDGTIKRVAPAPGFDGS